MKEYFEWIEKEVSKAYGAANKARAKGYDPEDKVDIPLATDMVDRSVSLVMIVAPYLQREEVISRIKELEKEYASQDWRVAMIISLEVAQGKFGKAEDEIRTIENGLRLGLAYLTNGVVASPLEGFTELKIGKRRDGKQYFNLYFAGPIRSAGTTAVCIFVALADYVRKHLGYFEYDIGEIEIKRNVTELTDFHERVTNLQYFPSGEELMFMLKHLPVQIDGNPTEKFEVSNYRDLDRIETNVLRNGVCLVLGECLTQKAAKFWNKFSKYCKDFEMDHWKFLDEYVSLQKKIRAKDKEDKNTKIKPDFTFIKDVVAGRPVFTYPMANGGFRLRYGRCRNSGLSSQAVHPATMIILDSFIAIGTQLKVERPGKATTIAGCDTIEGPTVKLRNGDVIYLDNEEEAKKVLHEVEEIIYLGDLLISYGDFLDRGHVLVPVGYCEEWWMQESGQDKMYVNVDEAIQLCKDKKVPLHPRYTFHWGTVNKEQFMGLLEWLGAGAVKEDRIVIPYSYNITQDVSDKDPKRVLELIGTPHRVAMNEYVVVEGQWFKALMFSLGNKTAYDGTKKEVLEIVNEMCGYTIRDKSGTFIGARMGRPEKAKMRKLTGSPQVLFPVGEEGGKLRDFQNALREGRVTAEFPTRKCDQCGETVYPVCEKCGTKTKQLYYDPINGKFTEAKREGLASYKLQEIDIHHYFDAALRKIGMDRYPELIKGVRGTSNEDHIPENLVKGILRAMCGIYVNRDGTTRYDMTETVLTHFKPKEIGVSVEKLRNLGYQKDVHNQDLINEDQILELRPQDVVLPSCPDALDEGADEILIRVGRFVDELLIRLYGEEPFYNFNNQESMVGHLVIALSPHTSAGLIARIIGFSKTQGFYAHPLLHAALRRDADGDECCVILLMDALLNYSRSYLPAHRGAKQDEPLVLTSKLIAKEVDDMAFNVDVCWRYPLELYRAALEYKTPSEIKVKTFRDGLGSADEFSGLGFTHDTSNINNGVRCSSYKSIPTMLEKVERQMLISEKIRAVDENDVAKLLIERHFIRDIKGNLRQFGMQQFRCVNCNEKYRRPPLVGKCIECNGKLVLTVAEGSIIKYLEPSLVLAQKYTLPAYLRQTLELVKQRIEGVFGKDEDKQEGLVKWFG